MQALLSNLEWGAVGLALIPLALALGVFIAERAGWVDADSAAGAANTSM